MVNVGVARNGMAKRCATRPSIHQRLTTILPLTGNANEKTIGAGRYRAGLTLVAHGPPCTLAPNVTVGLQAKRGRQLGKGKRPLLAAPGLPP